VEKIKEEELLKLLSRSVTISIIKAKLIFPMSTALIFFKEQVKIQGIRITREGSNTCVCKTIMALKPIQL
jgi:hypothetical protein